MRDSIYSKIIAALVFSFFFPSSNGCFVIVILSIRLIVFNRYQSSHDERINIISIAESSRSRALSSLPIFIRKNICGFSFHFLHFPFDSNNN